MPVVRIEHAVPHFEKWKEAFDRDPADRKGSGVSGKAVMLNPRGRIAEVVEARAL